ncbi:MAG: heme-dependent oxidative N-demethylase subunit alpha family protein [Betaproteobacteria bacterium]
MSFDFDAAVGAPFRMQPGLRRIAPGTAQLTPNRFHDRALREKLAVLSCFADQALLAEPGFDAGPALHALAAQAAREWPHDFAWDGASASAARLHWTVRGDVARPLDARAPAEIGTCLDALPRGWRLAGLLALAFAEDFAVVDGASGRIVWLAICLPSHWAPEDKVGRHFAEVHAPVADNALVVKAAEHLLRLVTGDERWERFVWTVTSHSRLHAHPARLARERWPRGAGVDEVVALARWRTERQTFLPLPALRQAVFTIHVELQPLAAAIDTPARARRLHDALASMSPAVLDYRNLAAVQPQLLDWLAARAEAPA